MSRSKKRPVQRKPSPTPRDEPAQGLLDQLWEPHCVAAVITATEHLVATAQEALDENERAYWTAISELGLAHEAQEAALATG